MRAQIATHRPRRCRWFGHYWVSTWSGLPIDEIITGGAGDSGLVACKRCGEDWSGPGMTPDLQERLRRIREEATMNARDQ